MSQSEASKFLNIDKHLMDNSIGDIVLKVTMDNEQHQLLVVGSILSDISRVFNASNNLSEFMPNFKVFDPLWTQRKMQKRVRDGSDDDVPVPKRIKWTGEPVPGEQQDRLPIIEIVDDFVTIQNLVYFAYTGQINLHHHVDGRKSRESSWPPETDAFSLYKAAHKYDIKKLEDRCFAYLCATCTTSNILSRLLNREIKHYEDLERRYLQFLCRRGRDVRNKMDELNIKLTAEIDLLLRLAESTERFDRKY